MMFTNENGTESYGLSNMSTMNDDQGALLNNEQRIDDVYILSYRFVIEYLFSNTQIRTYLDIDNLEKFLYVFVYFGHFYLHFS